MDSRDSRVEYPAGLKLEQVQIFFRHGERTPSSSAVLNKCIVSTEDQNARKQAVQKHDGGTSCNAASLLNASGPGQLTSTGFATCNRIGQSLRSQYIDQLALLPHSLDADTSRQVLKVRSTHYQRTFESAREVLAGLYPPKSNESNGKGHMPEIEVQDVSKETLLPGYQECDILRRLESAHLEQLEREWQKSDDAEYAHRLLRRWIEKMPIEGGEIDIKIVFDTVASVIAVPNCQDILPSPFFDAKLYEILEKWCSRKEHGLFCHSPQYQRLTVGPLLEEITDLLRLSKMVQDSTALLKEYCNGVLAKNDSGSTPIFHLHACHDTTLAGILCSLNIMGPHAESGYWWPSFGDVFTIEMFSQKQEGNSNEESYFIRLLYNGNAQEIPAVGKPSKASSKDLGAVSIDSGANKRRDSNKGIYSLTDFCGLLESKASGSLEGSQHTDVKAD